jgi:integrase
MARPPLPVGTHGKITVYPAGRGRYRARCRYRHYDGRVYPVERYGSTRTKAELRLREAIRDWTAPTTGAVIGSDTKFAEVARRWMADLERDAEQGHRSWGTVDTYRSRLTTAVLPAVGELRVREVTTPVCDRLCRQVRDQHSASSAKTVRAILSGICAGAYWPDFDEEAKLITMSGNVIRATGRGKLRNQGKTENSQRPIPLADWAVTMLLARRVVAINLDGPIFPSTTGTVREASNVRNRAWKPFAIRAGYDWVTFRTFRKTVATLLDDAGLTARQIADILGHSRPSLVQDVYMGRGTPNRAGAEALQATLTPPTEKRG